MLSELIGREMYGNNSCVKRFMELYFMTDFPSKETHGFVNALIKGR